MSSLSSTSRSVEAPAGLDPSVAVLPLAPFGALLRAARPLSVTTLAPAMLEALAREHKLVLLRGFAPIERDDFLAYCRTIPGGGLLEWDFGPVMEMHERPDAKNYLFSREAVPYHWDGAFHRVPSYLMFCCVEAPVQGAGGETLFCDTTRVWDFASAAERATFEKVQLTYATAKLAHYGGTITNPLVAKHPHTGQTVLRFAEPVETALNPVTLSISGVPVAQGEQVLATLTRAVYDPAHCYSHAWQPGDILMADNNALIHGRRAFERDCPRHLRRIQVL